MQSIKPNIHSSKNLYTSRTYFKLIGFKFLNTVIQNFSILSKQQTCYF